MTDEFRGAAINLRKWVPYSPFSFGTSPGLFVPSNVFVKHQVLHLTAKSEGLPEGAPSGFAKWTTGAVVSQAASLYGYFECCFRASNTALASRFGLEGGSQEESSEILVFSYSAIDKHKELVYMDAKYAMKNADGEVETVTHPLKKVIFEMPETPVTVGIDWTPDHLKTYVDGHVIRHLENKHWHSPMHVSFKLETAPAEFGLPTAEKLGSRDDFEIYYVRTWQRYPSERQETTPGIEDK